MQGICILDLTHMLSGPYATMILADMGADTIKVEPPQGEGTRKLLANDPNNSIDGMGAYFITLNRNKQSICIDLKKPSGLKLFYELVEKADVVINNFAADVPKRLQIDFEHLNVVNPRIITCSITGFGSNGPNYQRPAFDQVAQATGGGMSITGENKHHPVRAGIPIGDLGGGMFAVMGILAALTEREHSGKGQDIDISMLDCQISLLNYMATMYFLSGQNPDPIGNSHYVHVPYNSYATQDGHLIVAVITDNFWHNLKQLLKCPEFDNQDYDTQPGRLADKEIIDKKLSDIFATNTTDYWLQQLNEMQIPCAPVNSFSQALSDEQVCHRNMIVPLKHPNGKATMGPGNPIKFSRSNEESFAEAPLAGQHTDNILQRMLGYTLEDIEQMRTEGVVK